MYEAIVRLLTKIWTGSGSSPFGYIVRPDPVREAWTAPWPWGAWCGGSGPGTSARTPCSLESSRRLRRGATISASSLPSFRSKSITPRSVTTRCAPPEMSPACLRGPPAGQETRAGDEIHPFHEPALLVPHGHDHLGHTGDVIGPARTRQADLRLIGVPDEGAVQISELDRSAPPRGTRNPRIPAASEGVRP